MRLRLEIPAVAIGLFLLAGCSTPESRIAHHPEVFASLAPADQALVRAGRVGIGMDEQTVKLALGEPDRISTITRNSGVLEIWHYEENVYYDGAFLYYGPYWNASRNSSGFYRVPGANADDLFEELSYPIATYDHFRIGFTNNKVVSIRREDK